MKRFTKIPIGAAMIAAMCPLAAHGGIDPHEGDIIVGRTLAGVLAIEYDFDEPSFLSPVSGLFNGWAGDEPGFDHLEADEPNEDFYTLAVGANIVFELVSIDDALVGNPLTVPLNAPGAQFTLGDHELHTHINWLIDSDHPDFDPLQTLWTAEFKLIDTGTTAYGDSPVYTWSFTKVPEPGAATLLLAGLTLAGRRRRS